MKSLLTPDIEDDSGHPLDLVEDLAAANDWGCERQGDEITAAVPGSYCEFQLRFFWREEERILQIACVFDGRIAEARRAAVYEAIGLINERIWLGHFELWSDEGVVMYRHAVYVESDDGGIGGGHLALLIETALGEAERFYPVFQFVVWGGRSPREALDAALLETAGEA